MFLLATNYPCYHIYTTPYIGKNTEKIETQTFYQLCVDTKATVEITVISTVVFTTELHHKSNLRSY